MAAGSSCNVAGAVVWITTLALLVAAPVQAADDKKGGEQMRRMQQKIRTLEQEKSQLTQGKAEADTQLQSETEKLGQAQRNIDAANRQRAALSRDLRAAETARTALADQLAEIEKKLADTSTRLAETSATLTLREEAKRQLEGKLALSIKAGTECVAKNDSLHRLGVELLGKLEPKGWFGNGLPPEVLTRLKQVGTENMVEEYRDKLDQELINQQRLDRQALVRQTALLANEESAKLARDKAARDEQEREKNAERKARQQGTIDRLSKRVMDVFGNVEW